MTERRPGRWPGSRTGCGEIRNTANSATPNPATSSQYTKRTPAPASSSPASAGPATRPNWNSAWKMAFAVDTSDRRTKFGTMALRPALSRPLNPADSAGSTNNGHSAGPRSALTARPALHAAISTCAIISSRRRSMASTAEPPSSDPAISGNSWVTDTSPTISDEWVSWYTWYGTATVVSWLPRTDTSSPQTRWRKSRDRRSGVRSMSRRRAPRGFASPWPLTQTPPKMTDGHSVGYHTGHGRRHGGRPDQDQICRTVVG